MNMTWRNLTPESKAVVVRRTIATLKRNGKRAPSASQIAAAIGGISREAVIGVAYRCGIVLPQARSR